MRICAFIGDMYRDYSTAIIKHLQSRAVKDGHKIDVFGNCAVPSENPLHAEGLKNILGIPPLRKYDGIIICSDTLNHAGLDKYLLENLRSGTAIPPVVSVRCAEEGFYNIIPDNRKIMYDMAKHVIDAAKCGDIGFVTGKDGMVDAAERLDGFRDAMSEAGYEVNDDLIFHGNYWINLGNEMADFYTRKDGTLPRAIICSNDYMALGLIDALISRGYKIPEDTMITGIDNLEATRTHMPTITTADISSETFADAALDMLTELAEGRNPDKTVKVPGSVIKRESTGNMVERDIDEIFNRLTKSNDNYYRQMLTFGRLSADYMDVMNYDSCSMLTLKTLKKFDIFDKCYICNYGENSRFVDGFFEGDKIETSRIEYPNEDLLPKQFETDDPEVRIFLPIYFKNEVYGYVVLVRRNDTDEFIDESLEFMLMLTGQTVNRIQLYHKYFEVSDIMDLYVRDALTGIYNRRGFEKRISAMLNDDQKTPRRIAIASIDMDDLKYINDNFGHNAGDDAIRKIAKSLSSALVGDEFVARIGGDEFTAVLILDDPARIGQFIRNLRTSIKDANKSVDMPYKLSASIGTCEVANWDTLMEAMNAADKIMYVEKRTKKSGR